VALDRRSIRRALLVLIALLTAASLAVELAKHVLDRPTLGGLTRLLDTNTEGNIPTYYSALSLLACAVLLAVAGVAQRPASRDTRRGWFGLAAVAALASVDEASGVHEEIGALIGREFTPGGYLYFVGVVPAALFGCAVALAFRGFVAGLSVPLRRALTLGGGLWAGSALLVELVEGRIVTSSAGFGSIEYALVAALQEAGEMLGLVVILDGLLGHLAERRAVVTASVR
jgi:hypothetical protein